MRRSVGVSMRRMYQICSKYRLIPFAISAWTPCCTIFSTNNHWLYSGSWSSPARANRPSSSATAYFKYAINPSSNNGRISRTASDKAIAVSSSVRCVGSIATLQIERITSNCCDSNSAPNAWTSFNRSWAYTTNCPSISRSRVWILSKESSSRRKASKSRSTIWFNRFSTRVIKFSDNSKSL